MIGHDLTRALGVESPGDSLDVSLGGLRARLVHGDAFCTLDTGYHRLHAVLRSAAFRWVARHLPVRLIEALAVGLMALAARFSAAKPPEVMDIVDDDVRRALRAGADVVVCGHVHKARDERLGDDGRLVVLADFETTGSHAVFRDGRLELVPADPRFLPPPGPVVTLDGPAGSGKTSVAARLARRLGWTRLDSGALYRAVTAAALERGLSLDDGPALGALARALRLGTDRAGRVTGPHGRVPDALLRSPGVSAAVSRVSAHPEVRGALLEVQRRATRGAAGVVAEGRDMGTVVFPDALLKVYLDARLEVRARRRLEQNPGEGGRLEEVAAALVARDARDSSRAVAPLRPAPGAFVLDTSELDTDAVVERLAARVAEAQAGT
jgi:cytidylate kinase